MTDTNVHQLQIPRTVEQIRADIDAQHQAEAERQLEPLVKRARARAAELREHPPSGDEIRHAVKCWRGEGTET